ncbi:sulfite exporter TauE/SafE family protein [Streptomyces sp. NPDC058892]|uniref:urease accessory protein UreH domain-containing protein n=1 Tax=unclassified Streptomyces TaxID=2593676 RepID=UPI0036757679
MNPVFRAAFARLGLLAVFCCPATPAAAAAPAHPLGNFTVNYHTGLVLHPTRIDATVVVDRAEIAALQERPAIDTDHDSTLTETESRRYAQGRCSELAGQLRVRTAAGPARWQPKTSALTWEPGEAGLQTSRLTCTFSAPAALRRGGGVSVRTAYDTTRVGWREITARGVALGITGTDLPATSPTGELRTYPADPLASPLDQRTAELHTTPAASDTAATPAASTPVGRTADRVAGWFDSLVARRELTIPVGLLALVLALVLGASHALLPGHGKTLMAAYLAGRRGTRRDAVTVGATVTLTHTAGVLVLGLALPAATHLAGETVLAWLGATSGLIITVIGLWLLAGALRNRRHGHGHHHHGHGHGHRHGHAHGHGHGHGHHHHDHDQEERPHRQGGGREPAVPSARPSAAGPAPSPVARKTAVLVLPEPAADTAHPHNQTREPTSHRHRTDRRLGKAGLIGMGIAGGLVPSPSALVVLLGAVALGRTAFGVLLVLAYGLGMAGTLTLAGLLLLHLKERLQTSPKNTAARTLRATAARVGPLCTAGLVVLVGAGLTLRSLAG